MIEGVTKPFEYGRTIDPDIRRAATAEYLTSMRGLFERFDPYVEEDDTLSLDVLPEGANEPIPVMVTRRFNELNAVSSEVHDWRIGNDDFVERSDLGIPRKGEPDAKRFAPIGASLEDGLAAIKRIAADMEALGILHQPVDLEEVQNLFALLAHARPEGRHDR